ncbi:MAG: FAD-dependent monooxygenase [Oscillospiraceae bacterium]|nr:FAD-dependent monooxygenase [Oscillospiraceae bacterium]MBP3520409.1 FAD-dependent monooxygenase [Oscillospiraceae bacterium]
MLRIQNLTLPLDFSQEDLRRKAAKLLNVSPASLEEVKLLRQSVDARKKSDVRYICTVGVSVQNESALLVHCGDPAVTVWEPVPYVFPTVTRRSTQKPVVVGMGPAGLFAALFLARNGLPSIILERGRDVDARTEDVELFWKTGSLSRTSNVQFGEGGAGTFSDGKLNTGTHDPRISAVLEAFVHYGAPEDILYQQKPHVGTDVLRGVVKNIRHELISLGCEVLFEHQLTGLKQKDGCLNAVTVMAEQGPYELSCDTLILAPGHSARDTFRMLHETGIPMEPKAFAVGCRIEHDQAMISEAQYGPAWEKLPPADYKLACHLPSGRSAFTFCVCPGGQVVASASDYGQVVTNGMSLRARDGKNINGGFLVGVSPTDYEGSDPLAGVRFQEQWERAAWDLGTGGLPPAYAPDMPVFRAPAQQVADFLRGVSSSSLSGVIATYRPGVTPAALDDCLPGYVADTLRSALPILDRKLRGFADGGAVLTGIETRSSSPVRILRGEDLQSPLRGLYPCGEGAGYAGGITSAAVDGIRVAEAVARSL